ncbi:hypothetical protein Tco_1047789 [Tanacetum coccineum]
MVFNSPCLTDKKELIHHEGTALVLIKSTHVAAVVPKSVAGSRFPEGSSMLLTFDVQFLEGVLMKNKDAASSRDIQLICAEFSSIQVKTQADWMLLQSSYFNPQVPTGRVVVPTGRYVVPAGKVIIIVSPGRLSLVPTGRVLSPGSDNESDDASVHSEATIAQQQQNIQPQIITTVSNNNAKFPYLKKDEYEVLEKVGSVAYKLELLEELSRVHNTFHVSDLKKCYADEPLVVPLDGLHFDDKLQFVEEPVEIMDREVKRLKRSRIPIIKVRWNSKRGPEFTWEREDQFQKKYPHLYTKTAPSSSAAS